MSACEGGRGLVWLEFRAGRWNFRVGAGGFTVSYLGEWGPDAVGVYRVQNSEPDAFRDVTQGLVRTDENLYKTAILKMKCNRKLKGIERA